MKRSKTHIEDYWQSLLKSGGLGSMDLSPDHQRNLRWAFYAGATSVLGMLDATILHDLDEELDAFQQEIANFREELNRKRKQ